MKEYKYTINGNKYEVAIGEIVDNIATLTVNGEEFKVEMEREPEPQKLVVRPVVAPAPSPAKKAEQSIAQNALKAPLPGVITDILVEVGQEVQEEENIIVEKTSGRNFNRPRYRRLVRGLRPGDVLVVQSIDRLGRNYYEILEQWDTITKKRRAAIVVLDMPLLQKLPDNLLPKTL